MVEKFISKQDVQLLFMNSAHSFSDYIPQCTYRHQFDKIYNENGHLFQFLQHYNEYEGLIIQMPEPCTTNLKFYFSQNYKQF